MNTAHREIRRDVISINQLLTRDRNEARDVIRELLTLNPFVAKVYGIPSTTVTCGLAGWLAKQLIYLVCTCSSSHIKNNVGIQEKLRNYFLDNKSGDIFTLSFDVQSLFIQVPLMMS